MSIRIKVVSTIFLLFALQYASAQSGAARNDLANRIDAAVAAAYDAASARFPCKVKARGKPKMLRWEEVDRCLNGAVNLVDWDALAQQFGKLRAGEARVPESEFWTLVEASFSAHSLVYEKVFSAKESEDPLVPLTNSLLKHLPADSLQNLPVYDRAGTQVGTFLGIYSFERTGGLASANTYRLTLFQYSDRTGNVQGVGEKLLLDSFGVPWKKAKSQRGFRLTTDKLKTER